MGLVLLGASFRTSAGSSSLGELPAAPATNVLLVDEHAAESSEGPLLEAFESWLDWVSWEKHLNQCTTIYTARKKFRKHKLWQTASAENPISTV